MNYERMTIARRSARIFEVESSKDLLQTLICSIFDFALFQNVNIAQHKEINPNCLTLGLN